MEYDKINELFEPIFQWIKEHYPDGAYFLVDKNSAKLYANETHTVYSEEIKNYSKNTVSDVFNEIGNTILNDIEEITVKENKEEEIEKSFFILDQDRLE